MDLSTQKKYKVFIDDSFKSEADDDPAKDKSWYLELRGKLGVIYKYGKDGTMAATFTSQYQHSALAMIKTFEYHIKQRGEGELTFVFPSSDLNRVARLIQAATTKKRKPISEEKRKELVKRLAKGRKASRKPLEMAQI